MSYTLDGYWPAHVSLNKVAVAAGIDHSNLSFQIEQNRRNGKPLSAKLKSKIFSALHKIHTEVDLHCYEPRIAGALRNLREKEDLARQAIAALDSHATGAE